MQIEKTNNNWLEFKNKVLNLNGHRVHKINNSIGVYDIYKYIRKNKWFNLDRPITEHEFYSIIRTVNNYLVDNLLEGYDIKLPCRMGTIELRKYSPKIKIKDNKVKTTLPIDWDRTLKLWYEDQESYKNKTLVRMNEKEVFKIFYNRNKANYNNKVFYDLRFMRGLKLKLKEKIKEGLIDAFKLNKYD